MEATESHFKDLMDKARGGDRKAMLVLMYRYEKWLMRCRKRRLREAMDDRRQRDLQRRDLQQRDLEQPDLRQPDLRQCDREES